MEAFLGKTEVKNKYLSRVRAHREADELIKGKYWEHGKGCAVGCTIHSDEHSNYETLLGIPEVLARLEDGIFEALPNGAAMLWPERFLSAIEPGADLSLVWPRFAVWMLVDEKWGVLQFASSKRARKSIQDVAGAYESVVNGSVETRDWAALRSAAAADAAGRWAATAAAAARWAAARWADAAAAAASWADAAAADAAAAAADARWAAAAARWAATAAAAARWAAARWAATADAAARWAAAAGRWRSAQAEKLLELLAAPPIPSSKSN
jgi:hypothetical protein